MLPSVQCSVPAWEVSQLFIGGQCRQCMHDIATQSDIDTDADRVDRQTLQACLLAGVLA